MGSSDDEVDEVEESCPGCEDSAEEHDCGFSNEECPSDCAYTHEPPPTALRRRSLLSPIPLPSWTFDCPSGESWTWCHGCGEWLAIDNSQFTVIAGYNYCDPESHEYTRCDDCNTWVSVDDAYGEEYERLCSNCYDNAGSGESRPGEPRRLCSTCNTYNVYLDELSERFYCLHEAQAIKESTTMGLFLVDA